MPATKTAKALQNDLAVAMGDLHGSAIAHQTARNDECAAKNRVEHNSKAAQEALVQYLNALGSGYEERQATEGACLQFLRAAGYTIHKGQCE